MWRDNTRFLGCYGQYKPPYSIVNYIMKDEDDEKKDGGGDGGGDDDDDDDRSPYQIEFCEYNYIADLSQDVDGIVYIFKEDSWYYKVFSFPENVKFTGSDSSLDKWQHFHEDPDSFMIVQEGPLRGHAFEFKRDSYYHWSVDGKLLEDGIKISDIGETMERLEAIVDNSDFIEPLAVGFGQKYVCILDQVQSSNRATSNSLGKLKPLKYKCDRHSISSKQLTEIAYRYRNLNYPRNYSQPILASDHMTKLRCLIPCCLYESMLAKQS